MDEIMHNVLENILEWGVGPLNLSHQLLSLFPFHGSCSTGWGVSCRLSNGDIRRHARGVH